MDIDCRVTQPLDVVQNMSPRASLRSPLVSRAGDRATCCSTVVAVVAITALMTASACQNKRIAAEPENAGWFVSLC